MRQLLALQCAWLLVELAIPGRGIAQTSVPSPADTVQLGLATLRVMLDSAGPANWHQRVLWITGGSQVGRGSKEGQAAVNWPLVSATFPNARLAQRADTLFACPAGESPPDNNCTIRDGGIVMDVVGFSAQGDSVVTAGFLARGDAGGKAGSSAHALILVFKRATSGWQLRRVRSDQRLW
jgi:hypothetical protein